MKQLGSAMYDWKAGGFGLYVHWPFCESKCPYCDFNSHVAKSIDHKAWLAAYVSEIQRYGRETSGRILQTIYFGGGTPSLMQPDVVSAVVEAARSTWATVNDIEITLEANPSSVEAGRFMGYRDAGINRVSVGIQALDERALQALGRRHSVSEAVRALEIARNTFDRVSFDLIYARQDQTLSEWRDELNLAIELAGEHLSLYQLTIENGTAFADRAAKGGLKGLPHEDLSADLYELTQEICDRAGLLAYEVSNHAKEGKESRHNLIYWRAGDYVGIGPGAHGRITNETGRWAIESQKNPNTWLNAHQHPHTEASSRTALTASECALEYLLMSLRTSEGMSLDRYHKMSSSPLPKTRVDKLVDLGMLENSGDRVYTTPAGRMVLNAVLRELAAD